MTFEMKSLFLFALLVGTCAGQGTLCTLVTDNYECRDANGKVFFRAHVKTERPIRCRLLWKNTEHAGSTSWIALSEALDKLQHCTKDQGCEMRCELTPELPPVIRGGSR